MFDHIKCKALLPIPNELQAVKVDWKNVDFQTKDLENCLLQYVITPNGFLDEIVTEYEYVPFAEGETPPNPWTLYKEINEINTYVKPIKHHGTIRFYSVVDSPDSIDFEYIVEFLAYFIYGHLDKIDLIECKKIQSQHYHRQQLTIKKQLDNKLFLSRAKRLLGHLGWFWFWRHINHILYVFERTIISVRTSIIRKML